MTKPQVRSKESYYGKTFLHGSYKQLFLEETFIRPTDVDPSPWLLRYLLKKPDGKTTTDYTDLTPSYLKCQTTT